MITTQFIKMFNSILKEYIVQARIVGTQTVDFADWCLRMANGSTVTAADVAAVMQQIEDKLPEILSLNAKVVCSPGGLTFRPKVTGSLTQSQLKARLEARKAAEVNPEKAAKINVDRELQTSDLSVSDCTVCIEIVLPKFWDEAFKKRAQLKRVKTSTTEVTETSDGDGSDSDGGGGGSTGGETPTGGGSETGGGETPTEGGETGGGEDDPNGLGG